MFLFPLGLGEEFNFQCAATTNHSRIDRGEVDSRNVVGSHMWFCGYQGFGASVARLKEGFVSIFSYHDGKYMHVNVSLTNRNHALNVLQIMEN